MSVPFLLVCRFVKNVIITNLYWHRTELGDPGINLKSPWNDIKCPWIDMEWHWNDIGMTLNLPRMALNKHGLTGMTLDWFGMTWNDFLITLKWDGKPWQTWTMTCNDFLITLEWPGMPWHTLDSICCLFIWIILISFNLDIDTWWPLWPQENFVIFMFFDLWSLWDSSYQCRILIWGYVLSI